MSRIRELVLPFQPGVLVAAMLMVTACGTSSGDRAVSGAGIGAAAGTVVGAVTGLSLLQGALIGAGVGGAAGVLTDPEDVNLGEPVWRQSSQSGQGSGPDSTVRGIQTELADLGYDPGTPDGLYGPRTGAAIRRYQQDHSLQVNGQPSSELLAHIRRNRG